MTRRSLLAMLTAAIADPDRLLWTPGKKLISIPKPRPNWWIDHGAMESISVVNMWFQDGSLWRVAGNRPPELIHQFVRIVDPDGSERFIRLSDGKLPKFTARVIG